CIGHDRLRNGWQRLRYCIARRQGSGAGLSGAWWRANGVCSTLREHSQGNSEDLSILPEVFWREIVWLGPPSAYKRDHFAQVSYGNYQKIMLCFPRCSARRFHAFFSFSSSVSAAPLPPPQRPLRLPRPAASMPLSFPRLEQTTPSMS